MGFCEVLTIVFIALKLLGHISWSWFYVLLPEIIAIVLYILFFIFGFLGMSSFNNKWKKF